MTTRNQAGEALIARLEGMVPDLMARGRDAEEAGRIPEATIAELRAAGAFRAVVPERMGGLELPFPYVPRIFRTLGRGCTSTAWCMGFLIYHNFQFAHFPERAQAEAWGATAQTMAPGQVMPSGRAERVEGGYRVSGRWGYATGIQHGDWMLFSSPVETPEGTEIRRFFAPVSEFTVLDTWHVAAMRATGSHDVTCEGLFVPEHRSILVSDLREGRAAGLTLNPGPLWRVPLLSFMSYGAVGPMLGAAEAMFGIVSEGLKAKVGAYSGDRQAGLMTQRVRMARLETEIRALGLLYEDGAEMLWSRVTAGAPVTREDRARARMVVATVAAESARIVNELARAAGSRGNYLDSPVQRFQRDVAALATHALFEYDHIANLHGGALLGQGIPDGAMI
jgi:3-hydroxy-9,10-secoandrosta-1,3,5(10)-triene-9,17-dione monooxygenase